MPATKRRISTSSLGRRRAGMRRSRSGCGHPSPREARRPIRPHPSPARTGPRHGRWSAPGPAASARPPSPRTPVGRASTPPSGPRRSRPRSGHAKAARACHPPTLAGHRCAALGREPAAEHETMEPPAVPVDHSQRGMVRCQLPIGSRRSTGTRLPDPIVRATQPTRISKVRLLVPRYSSGTAAMGRR